jgi:hypothetical protein
MHIGQLIRITSHHDGWVQIEEGGRLWIIVEVLGHYWVRAKSLTTGVGTVWRTSQFEEADPCAPAP